MIGMWRRPRSEEEREATSRRQAQTLLNGLRHMGGVFSLLRSKSIGLTS